MIGYAFRKFPLCCYKYRRHPEITANMLPSLNLDAALAESHRLKVASSFYPWRWCLPSIYICHHTHPDQDNP